MLPEVCAPPRAVLAHVTLLVEHTNDGCGALWRSLWCPHHCLPDGSFCLWCLPIFCCADGGTHRGLQLFLWCSHTRGNDLQHRIQESRNEKTKQQRCQDHASRIAEIKDLNLLPCVCKAVPNP